MIRISNATNQEQLDAVRSLMCGFVAWHRQRHVEDIALIDAYFDDKAFEAELAVLPGAYAPPMGRLLLSHYGEQPAGCVALRPIDTRICEMKRMFVYSHLQGKGVGRLLVEVLLREAKTIGYTSVRLDTSFRQTEAQKLYRSFGFKHIPPYYDLPVELKNWLVFMELRL